jgi:hypothetical protein
VPKAGKKPAPAPLTFGDKEWAEEVERLDGHSLSRVQAERARREIEKGKPTLVWRPCEVAGADGTRLPGCRKLYIPLGEQGASAAPFGFVFQLRDTGEGLVWAFRAFGERHPGNAATRSVYERAHKRLHGRYP